MNLVFLFSGKHYEISSTFKNILNMYCNQVVNNIELQKRNVYSPPPIQKNFSFFCGGGGYTYYKYSRTYPVPRVLKSQ